MLSWTMELAMDAEKVRLSPEDQAFFKKLGARIAAFRKERGLTQVQLAELADEYQQRIAQFEQGHRRIQVTTLAVIAKALGASVEELLGTDGKPAKRGPTPKLQRQFEQVSKLSPGRQKIVSRVLDGLLQGYAA